jgi:predicted nucleic acid-binding protein
MVKALFDTNVLIDFLGGSAAAREEVGRYDDKAISIVSWMEVLVGAPEGAADATRSFLERFGLVEVGSAIADDAVQLRRTARIKLPDAIVWASARTQGRLLVTRNTKDFPVDDPGVRVPYPAP